MHSTNENMATKNPVTPNESNSLSSVHSLRKQARQHIEQGAVTTTYSANRVEIIKLLNAALATELLCVLRYRSNYYMARGIHTKSVANEFLMHSNEELGHADLIANRIVQLGGEPNFSPDQLTAQSHAEYILGATLEAVWKFSSK